MKNSNLNLAALILAAAWMVTRGAQAQMSATLTDVGASAPTPGANDAYQLTTPAAPSFPDGLNYYFDNSIPPGQTFTTGLNANGYVLNTISIATAGDSGSLPAGGQSYTLRLYSVTGNTATLLATYVSQAGFTFTDLDWLQWSGLGFGLQSNSVYAYTFERNSAGYENLANVSGNPYPGGEVALIPAAGGPVIYGGSHGYDASFDVGMTLAASLVANAPSISPSSSVPAGSTATITTGPAAGSGSMSYQWQTDGGGGGALTNIPGATGLSLVVNTTGLPLGAYNYAVVVGNGSTSVSSSVATMTVTAGTTGNINLADAGSSISPGTNDISQLIGGGNGDGLNYYDDNRPMPGQTFTTGTNVFGYSLSSLSIGTGGGTSGSTGTAQSYILNIYSVANNQATLIATFTNSSFSFTYGDWLTWSGFPNTLVLEPNSTYAYAFGRGSTGWAGMASSPTNANLYPGGQLCLIPAGGGAITYGASGNSDAAFDLSLSPVGNLYVPNYKVFGDGFYHIVNQQNGLALTASGAGASQASQASSATLDFGEQFEVLYNFEDNTFRLRAHDTWQCLEAQNASTAVGTAVVEDPNYVDAAYQHWRLIDVGGGNYMIANLASGLVLQTDNGSPPHVTLAAPAPNNPSQIWQTQYVTHYPKKGMGEGNADWNRFGLSWYYDWGMFTDYPTDTLPPHVVYEPMQWGLTNPGPYENIPTDCGPMRTNSKPVYIMSFNEPNRPDQANMSVGQAIPTWPYFLAANLPIVSPSTSLGGETGWLSPFFDDLWSDGYRCEYTSMHWYSSPSADAIISHAQWEYGLYGNPCWITEFCNIAFGYTGNWSEEDCYQALYEFMWRAEDIDYIARHAWFPQNYVPNTNPWDPDGVNAAMYAGDWYTLTALGEMWAAFDADRTLHTMQPYYLHSEWQCERVTATPGTNSVTASTIRQSGIQQQIQLVDAGSGMWYIQTLLDGRRLSYDGANLAWVAEGTTGTNVQWTITSAGNSYWWVNNPAWSVTLRGECSRDSDGYPYILYYDVDTMGDPNAGNTTLFNFIKPYFAVNLYGEVAHYTLDGNANDSDPGVFNGQVSPLGVSFVAGHGGGQAAQFDGQSGYITVPATPLKQQCGSLNSSFSIAFWMHTTQTGGNGSVWTAGAGLVDGTVNGSPADFGISLVGNKVAFGCGNPNTTIVSTTAVNNGQWHYVAATRMSTGAMQLFVDGALQGTANGGSWNRFSPQLLRFGGQLTGVNFYNGALDDVRFYSYALPSAQVSALYTNVPSSWTDADIGNPLFSGYANFSKLGIWTVGGGGADIWNQADQFNFLYQPVTGNDSLITRVTTLPVNWDGSSPTNSKAGLMFRESTNENSVFVDLDFSTTNGIELQYRDSTGALASQDGTAPVPIATAPFWIKLERTGNIFSAFYALTPGTPSSGDWIFIDAHSDSMSTNMVAGIAATAGYNGSIVGAGFESLQLAADPPGDVWRDQYFGTPLDAGIAADGANPAGDGIDNAMKRFLGLNPLVSYSSSVLPQPGINGANRTITYTHNLLATDLSWQVQWSPDLSDWLTNNVTDTAVSTNGNIELRQGSVPASTANPLFMRVQVTTH